MNEDKRKFLKMPYAKEILYLGTSGIFQFSVLFIWNSRNFQLAKFPILSFSRKLRLPKISAFTVLEIIFCCLWGVLRAFLTCTHSLDVEQSNTNRVVFGPITTRDTYLYSFTRTFLVVEQMTINNETRMEKRRRNYKNMV